MSTEPPVHTYLSAEGHSESGGEESKRSRPVFLEVADRILSVLTWVVLGVVLLIWAVVGVFFWIPLLLRAVFRFSISLIEAMFAGQKPVNAAKVLRDAVSFYRRGFVSAIEVVTRKQIDDADQGPVTENRLLFEIFWALLVWYFIFLLLGWVQASPMDLWDWLVSIPWREIFGDLLERLRP